MAQAFPVINGVKFDYSSIEITTPALPGVRFAGVKSIDYSDALDPGMAYGTSAQPAGRTRGKYVAEGSMEVYKADFQDLLSALTASGIGYMEAVFDVIVMYAEPSPANIVTDTLRGCRLKKIADAHAEGSDPLTVKCDLSIMYLLRDGASPLTTLSP